MALAGSISFSFREEDISKTPDSGPGLSRCISSGEAYESLSLVKLPDAEEPKVGLSSGGVSERYEVQSVETDNSIGSCLTEHLLTDMSRG